MKVRVTLDFSDEERMALGSDGNKATHEEMENFVVGCATVALPDVVKKYYQEKIDALK
jgi:hypothetical protein